MIKAVFFDLYHTLVRYEPPREELQANALHDLGISVEAADLREPIIVADEFIYQELARIPLDKRDTGTRQSLYIQYQQILLKEAGISATGEQVKELLMKMQQVKMNLVLFDDVLPALNKLKNNGLILGLVSNVDYDINPLMEELGLSALLQIIITSQKTGYTKPSPEIYREALRQAQVLPEEAFYIGDQYQVDIIGAQNAGMTGLLLDRGNYFKDIPESLRIHSLSSVIVRLGI